MDDSFGSDAFRESYMARRSFASESSTSSLQSSYVKAQSSSGSLRQSPFVKRVPVSSASSLSSSSDEDSTSRKPKSRMMRLTGNHSLPILESDDHRIESNFLQLNRQLEEEILQTRSQKESLEARINEKDVELECAYIELETAEDKAAMMRRDLDNARAMLESMRKEKEDLKRQVESLNGDKKDLARQVKAKQDDRQDIDRQIGSMEDDKENFLREIDSLRASEQDLLAQKDELEDELHECRQKMAEADEQDSQVRHGYEDEIADLRFELEKAQTKANDAAIERDEQVVQNAQLTLRLDTQVLESKGEALRQHAAITDLESQLVTLRIQYAEAQAKVGSKASPSLSTDLLELKDQMQLLRRENLWLGQELKSYQQKRNDDHKKRDQTVNERHRLEFDKMTATMEVYRERYLAMYELMERRTVSYRRERAFREDLIWVKRVLETAMRKLQKKDNMANDWFDWFNGRANRYPSTWSSIYFYHWSRQDVQQSGVKRFKAAAYAVMFSQRLQRVGKEWGHEVRRERRAVEVANKTSDRYNDFFGGHK